MSGERGGAETRFEGGGLLWTIDAGGPSERALIEETLARWPDLPGDPRAAVLKRNIARTVVLLDPRRPPGAEGPERPESAVGRWVLKQYRHGGLLDRARFRFTPSRAEREWRGLRRLRALGFDAPRPIAFGERRVRGAPVEGGLLMEEVPAAALLLERLRGDMPAGGGEELPAAAAEVLRSAGALLAALQDRGVDQFDLHAGNFLVRAGGPGGGSIHVIDVHSARFRRRLSARRRRAGLTKLVHSLRGTVPASGVRVLLEAYGMASGRAGGGEAARLEEEVERGARRLERRRLRSRSRRCVVESTRFSVERGPGERLFRRREVPREHLAVLCTDPPPFPALKRGPGGWVGLAEIDGRGYLVKRRRSSLLASLLGVLGGHRLRRAYRAGFALEVRGVATPRVLALREERCLGLVRGAWLITEPVPGGVTLADHLSSEYLGRPPPRGDAARRKFLLARRVGELIRAVHDAGVSTQDLSPQNIIVSPLALEADRSPEAAAAVSIADLDSVHLWKRPGRGRRLRNLVQAGNLPEGHITWTDRLRALRAYARGDRWPLSRETIAMLREGLLREAERTLGRMLRRSRRSTVDGRQ